MQQSQLDQKQETLILEKKGICGSAKSKTKIE
jgi:hypothetical protein